ncbi:MAG: 7-cyano-7-deazaguanine synthase QueC [Oligoflexia bacterium]|nr:7-cyano-7-deazaguanine synthase QueC [Oligoflexia bacterium]
MREASVVLLSGGLDSAANLALCVERDEPLLALTARYGQRAAESEARAARALCAYYGVRHELIELPWLGSLGGSALTDGAQGVPVLVRAELDEPQVTRASAKAVWVPNRNGVLVNAAAAFAERHGARRVVVGFNREEAVTFPDNSEEFLARASEAFRLSTATRVELFSYTVRMDKREIVETLKRLSRPFPFGELWSCYFGGEKPCGRCESCQRLERALAR